MSDSKSLDSALKELDEIKTYQRFLLETLKSSVILLDENDVIVDNNEAALKLCSASGARIVGKRLGDTDLLIRCLESSKHSTDIQYFEYRPTFDGEEHCISVTLAPVIADDGTRVGTLIYAEDITHREKLRNTVEQLEFKEHELQSVNEELETTNDELQTTNEALETTNEELQATNEELEITNEELQSLNEELESINEELEARTHALSALTTKYVETLPWPVLLVDNDKKIQSWNSAAGRFFQINGAAAINLDLDQLSLEEPTRCDIIDQWQSVLRTGKPSVVRGQNFKIDGFDGDLDVHFTPIAANDSLEGVLIMFGPLARKDRPGGGTSKEERLKKSPARKSKPAARSRAKASANKPRRVARKRTPPKKR